MRARLIFALAALLALSACSRFPYVYLINSSGMLLEVLRAEGDGDDQTSERVDGWFFGYVWIADGAGREVMWRWPDSTAWFEARSRGCIYRYVIPTLETTYNQSAVVQIGPDRKLNLIAPGVWGDPRDDYPQPVNDIPAQPDGFPVEPATRCSAS